MNFNSNLQTLQHLITARRKPETALVQQGAFTKQRLDRVYSTLATRPHFIGLRFDFAAAASVSPETADTPNLKHDVIVTGAITNGNYPFEIERANQAAPTIYTGNEVTARLKLDEYAGKDVNSAGFPGVFYHPNPHVLLEGSYEKYKVFKLAPTADPETIWLALVGIRVYADSFAEAQLSPAQVKRANEAIAARPSPRTHFVKSKVEFINGKASLKTPKMEEPHIIRGIKTNLNHSLIKFNVEGEADLMSGFVPIWAVAAESDNGRELYQWQQRGIFLDSEKRIEGELLPSLDGVNTDPNGEITWILETL